MKDKLIVPIRPGFRLEFWKFNNLVIIILADANDEITLYVFPYSIANSIVIKSIQTHIRDGIVRVYSLVKIIDDTDTYFRNMVKVHP